MSLMKIIEYLRKSNCVLGKQVRDKVEIGADTLNDLHFVPQFKVAEAYRNARLLLMIVSWFLPILDFSGSFKKTKKWLDGNLTSLTQ